VLPSLKSNGRPHWETSWPQELWPLFEEFSLFLGAVWDHHGLPAPTEGQLEIALRLQYGKDSSELPAGSAGPAAHALDATLPGAVKGPREDIVWVFRSAGKSYITAAFALWLLLRNPTHEKVLIISATRSKAAEFVDQLKGLVESMELCSWLLDGPRANGARRRDLAQQFDVAGSSLSQSYSVKAVGITSQITGSRATTVIVDDIETPENSKAEESRKNLIKTVQSDLGPVRKTEHGMGDLFVLGTPQTEESVYLYLIKSMGFSCFCIPARYPRSDKRGSYIIKTEGGLEVDVLAPYLQAKHDAGLLKDWQVTDSRYSNDELIHLESKGRSTFLLQYMLDTSLADAERYPLKTKDIIAFSVHPEKAPLTIQWGRDKDRKNVLNDIPNLGFIGDYTVGPLFIDDEWRRYNCKVMFVDPAGTGKDETAWAIVGVLGGTYYLLELDAHQGDPDTAMRKCALAAKAWDVAAIEIEPNYAKGVWIAGFRRILGEVWRQALESEAKTRNLNALDIAALKERGDHHGCSVRESEWAKGQKETRIIGTMEPVMAAHRLVVSEAVLRREAAVSNRDYSFLYQLTHITGDRGALAHEDKLEAVSGAVAILTQHLGVDIALAKKAVEEDEMQQMVNQWSRWAEADMPMRDDGVVTVVGASNRTLDPDWDYEENVVYRVRGIFG
jgi:hypothetical protein